MIGTKAWLKVIQAGYVDKEFADVKLVWNAQIEVCPLFTASKPVTTLEDLKGLKIRTVSPQFKERVDAWGATAVSVPLGETIS